MINLKGYRKITVDGIQYYYKCLTHEKTVVYNKPQNKIFYLLAANSGEVNKMSLPSLVSEIIKEINNKK